MNEIMFEQPHVLYVNEREKLALVAMVTEGL